MNPHSIETDRRDLSSTCTKSSNESADSGSKMRAIDVVSMNGSISLSPSGNATMPMSLLHNAILAAGEASHDVDDEKKIRARKNRLEQNRKAARESRRRKKMMIDELQRSVIFFTRANSALRQQNNDLCQRMVEAQRIVTAIKIAESQSNANVGTDQQVSLEQGFESNDTLKISSMQIGATMKAMAKFQEAASAAMQSAIQGLVGVHTHHLDAPSDKFDAKQAATDTITALAMQSTATSVSDSSEQASS